MNRVLVLAFAVFLVGEVKEVVAEPVPPYVPQVQGLDVPGSLQIRRISGICPQNRTTRKAPGRYLKKKNPIPPGWRTWQKGNNFITRMLNLQPASYAMGPMAMAMVVWQEGWTRLPETLPVQK